MARNRSSKKNRGAPPVAPYEGVLKALRKRICAGEWAGNGRLPSFRALAEAYGVGMQVARHAVEVLSKEGLVEVLPRRGVVARSSEKKWLFEKNLILQVHDDTLAKFITRSYASELQKGIHQGASNCGASLIIAGHHLLRSQLPMDMGSLPLRGILLVGHFKPQVLSNYASKKLPVVRVDAPPGRDRFHSVSVDNRRAAYEAAARLIKQGHKRLAFVRLVSFGARSVEPDARERQEGFVKALKEAGLPFNPGHIANFLPLRQDSDHGIRELFKVRPRFTAVLVAGSWEAQMLLAAAESAGVAVPQQLSVAAFHSANDPEVKLSGPKIDFREMGLRAINLLAKPKSPPVRMRVPAPWSNGETVGPARKSKR